MSKHLLGQTRSACNLQPAVSVLPAEEIEVRILARVAGQFEMNRNAPEVIVDQPEQIEIME